MPLHARDQSTDNFTPGSIAASMQDPRQRVRRFACEMEVVSAAIETRAPFDQPQNFVAPLMHQDAHRIGIAQTCARGNSVFLMQREFVLVSTQRNRNPAASPRAAAILGSIFGDHQHAPTSVCQLQRRPQSCDTSPDHEHIAALFAHPVLLKAFGMPRNCSHRL
jgi:hypothetical protein